MAVYVRSIGVSPTVVDETLFVGGEGVVRAIDVVEGAERWRFELAGEALSSSTVVGETLFVGSGDGNVYALDVTDGSERWRFPIGGWDGSSPIVDGTLFVGTDNGTVYALDAGVQGSSEDSRVLLGTDGHHHAWAETASTDVAPDDFVIDLDADPVPAIAGEPVRVRITVENAGGERGERELRFTGDGLVFEDYQESIELDGGESRTIPISGTVGAGFSRSELTVRVSVWEDEAELTIPVRESSVRLEQLRRFGPLGAFGTLGGVGYLLNRRYGDE